MTAFMAGFAFEFAYLAWIYAASRGWPLLTAGLSMVVGLVSVTGMREALHTRTAKWFLILGYGAGSYCAAWLKCFT